MPGGLDRGEQRAGVGGLIRLSGNSAPFHGDTFFYSTTTESQLKKRLGRGSTTAYIRFRTLGIGSNVIIKYHFQTGGTPGPVEPIGTTGDITFQIDTGKTITVPIVVTGFGPNFDVNKNDTPFGSITARVSGPLVYAGWPSDEPSPTGPTKTDQEQFDGTTKHVDPSGLTTGATRLTDVWGSFANTDAAEEAIISAFISAALPPITALPHDVKLRDVAFARDSIDGGTVVETWGLTTTAEDVENASTFTKTDAQKIQTGGVVAKINTTDPTLPTISGQTVVSRGITKSELNDSEILYKKEFGQLDTQDDITYPGTHKDIDVSDLTSTGISTSIFANGGSATAAPDWTASGIQPVKHYEIRINRDEWRAVDEYAKDTTKQSWEQEHSHETTDAGQLASEAESGAVDDATPPAPVNASLVIRYQRVQAITHDHTGYVDVYGLRTTTQDIEFPGTHARIDKSGLKSEGIDTNVYTTSGGVPADASSPDASLQTVATEIIKINQVNSEKHTYFDVNTAAENVIFPEAVTFTDASGLKSTRTYGSIYTTGSEPAAPGSSGLVLRDKKAYVLASPTTSNKSVTFWLYAEVTHADDETFPRTKTETDPDGIESSGGFAIIFTTGTPPADPTPPGDLKIYSYADIPLTDASASNKSIRVYRYELMTSAEKIERDGTEVTDDPSILESEAQETFVFNDGDTPPTFGDETIDLPTDVEPTVQTLKQLNDGKWKTGLKWAMRNAEHAITWLRSKYTAGTSQGVSDVRFVVEVTGSATAVAPANPDSTHLSYWGTESNRQTNGKWVHVHQFRPFTAEEEIEADGTESVVDPVTSLAGDDTETVFDTNVSPPTAPTHSGRVCVKVITKRKGKTGYSHKYFYDFRSVGDAHEAKNTRTKIDASAIESEATTGDVWLVSGGAPSTPTLSGFVLISSTDVEIENPLYRLRIYEWGLVTNQQKIENSATRGAGDPLGEEEAILGAVVASSGSSAQTLSNTYTAAITDPLKSVEYRTLTPAKALQIVKTRRDQGTVIESGCSGGLEEVKGIPNPGGTGYGDPDAKQLCSRLSVQIYSPLAGANSGLVQPIGFWRSRSTLRYVVYRIVDDEADMEDWKFPEWLRTSNDDELFGKPANTLLYCGAEAKVCLELPVGSGKLLVRYVYVWEFDDALHFKDTNLMIGWVDFTVGVSSPGYFQPDTFIAGGSFCVILWPGESDMSGVLL